MPTLTRFPSNALTLTPPNTLTLIRGLPGCGKSTLAGSFLGKAAVISTDDFMVDDDGKFCYTPALLGHCHKQCQDMVDWSLSDGHDIVVANTLVEAWEVDAYRKIADQHGANVLIIDLFDAGLTDEELSARNVHGVPVSTIANMRAKYAHNL